MTVTAVVPVAAHAGASCEELALMRESAARLAALAPGPADRLGVLSVPFTRTQEGSQPMTQPAPRETAAALRGGRMAAKTENSPQRMNGAARCPAQAADQEGQASRWARP